MKLCNIFIKFRAFQVFGIMSIFNNKVITNNKNILTDKINFKKMLIFLLFSYLFIYYKQFHILINIYIINNY